MALPRRRATAGVGVLVGMAMSASVAAQDELGSPARPEVVGVRVAAGELILVRDPEEAGPVALSGGEVVFVRDNGGARPTVLSYDPRTGDEWTLVQLPPRNDQRTDVVDVLPFINGEAVAIVATYQDADGDVSGHELLLHDLARDVTDVLSRREHDEARPSVAALDWSLRNEVLVYAYDEREPARWQGEIVRVGVFPRREESVTDRFDVTGWPTLAPGGRWLVSTTGPDATEAIPYRVWLVDLETGERRRLFERFGSRVATFEGRGVMTPTPAVWTAQEDAVVFADTDHAADTSPLLMRVPLSGLGIEERSLHTPGDALDVVALEGEAFAVLVRRLGDGAHVVEVVTFADDEARVVYVDTAGRVRLVGWWPG